MILLPSLEKNRLVKRLTSGQKTVEQKHIAASVVKMCTRII